MKRIFIVIATIAALIVSPLQAAWVLVKDTDFSGIGNTGAPGAGGIVTDGWIDSQGGNFSVASGHLKCTTNDTNGYQGVYCYRPTGEDQQDSRIVATFLAGDLLTSGSRGLMLRKISANSYYLVQIGGGSIIYYKLVSGTATSLLSTTFTYDNTKTYTVDFAAQGNGTTTFTLVITNVTDSSVVYNASSVTDNTAALQAAGRAGVTGWGSGAVPVWSRLQTYSWTNTLTNGTVSTSSPTSTSLSISWTAATGGTSPYTYAVYRHTSAGFTPPGTGTLLSSNATSPYSSTGLSASTTYYYRTIVTDNVSATALSNEASGTTSASSLTDGNLSQSSVTTTTATLGHTAATGGTSPYTYALYRHGTTGFTPPGTGTLLSSNATFPYTDTGLTASTTYYYRVIVTDNVSATALGTQLTVVTASSVTAGTLSISSLSNTIISVTTTAATGGTSPYTYALYRSNVSNFTPSVGNRLSSAAGFPYNDNTAPPGINYYRVIATDAGSQTSTSNQITASLVLAPLKVGFIGDSIMTQTPSSTNSVIQCGAYLSKVRNQRTVTVYNQAISGTHSGDWVSGSGNLTSAKAVFASNGVTLVIVMIGTNDARLDISRSAANYLTNMQSMVTSLTGSGYTVMLNYSPAITPNQSANWSEAALALIQSYQAQIDSLVNGTTVLAGDKLAFQYFGTQPSLLSDGVHPVGTGMDDLGRFWAAAYDRAINPASAGTRAFGF